FFRDPSSSKLCTWGLVTLDGPGDYRSTDTLDESTLKPSSNIKSIHVNTRRLALLAQLQPRKLHYYSTENMNPRPQRQYIMCYTVFNLPMEVMYLSDSSDGRRCLRCKLPRYVNSGRVLRFQHEAVYVL